jgi:hypothetical protein
MELLQVDLLVSVIDTEALSVHYILGGEVRLMSWLVSIIIVLLVWFFLFEVVVNYDLLEDMMEDHPKIAKMFDWLWDKLIVAFVITMMLSFFGFWVIISHWIFFGR